MSRASFRPFSYIFTLLATFALTCAPVQAASLIRDAEVEHTLRAYADPIFTTAGLLPSAIHLFIVQDDSINAYVAGGANMFIHTGLIMETRNPGMLIGVMAHETGHIAGGHLARGAEQLKSAQLGVILGYVLGAAAAAAGSPDVGMAVMTGGQSAIMRNFMSFTRSNEQAADQAALGYLDKLGISASGLTEMFQTLYRKEMQHIGTPDPYMLTHPLSADRIEHVRNQVAHSAIPEGTYPQEFNEMHKRMLAKLYSFMELPPKTFQRYPLSDHSVAARMARAIAWHKMPDPNKACTEIDALAKEYPDDAFLADLQGQIQFENGRIQNALQAYGRATRLMSDSALMLTSLGEAYLGEGSAASIQKALSALERANALDNSNARSWRLLATAYGKHGDIGMSQLALAEEAALNFEPDIARRQAEAAIDKLPPGAPGRLRAEDLKRLAAEMKRQKEEQ